MNIKQIGHKYRFHQIFDFVHGNRINEYTNRILFGMSMNWNVTIFPWNSNMKLLSMIIVIKWAPKKFHTILKIIFLDLYSSHNIQNISIIRFNLYFMQYSQFSMSLFLVCCKLQLYFDKWSALVPVTQGVYAAVPWDVSNVISLIFISLKWNYHYSFLSFECLTLRNFLFFVVHWIGKVSWRGEIFE